MTRIILTGTNDDVARLLIFSNSIVAPVSMVICIGIKCRIPVFQSLSIHVIIKRGQLCVAIQNIKMVSSTKTWRIMLKV